MWYGDSWGRRAISVSLKSGLRLQIRSLSTTDYDVAWEIFWRGSYECPESLQDVRRIVDLGANVGYSCLFWCTEYPESHATAFEPNPLHLNAIDRHLNGLHKRVEVVAAAAGTKGQSMYLNDAGSSPTVTDRPIRLVAYPVHVLDVFRTLTLAGAIDILKIDIEGGEYSLLADPRFGELDVRTLVLSGTQNKSIPTAAP
jgi:FkbM family methyltransferase